MKIIDLLNLIASGKKVPETIRYNGKIYTYNGLDYMHEEEFDYEYGDFIERIHLMDRVALNKKYLNEEVEIITYE